MPLAWARISLLTRMPYSAVVSPPLPQSPHESFREVTRTAAERVRSAVGTGSTVGISLANGNGRLRLAESVGEGIQYGRLRSARRRSAFDSGEVRRLPLPQDGTHELVLLPLAVNGSKLGILEIVASTTTIERRWETLGALGQQTALVIHSAMRNEALESRARMLRTALEVSARLALAESREEALRAATAVCHLLREKPTAGWVSGDGPETFLTATRGLRSEAQRELWQKLGVLARWDTLSDGQRLSAVDSFARIAGHEHALALPAEGAVLMIAGVTESSELLQQVRESLDSVLRRLSNIEWAKRRDGQIHLGIAWTAHEVRSPLLGAKAAIERLLATPDGVTSQGHELLERSRDELVRLADLIVPLLQWSAGGGTLRRRPTDLIRIVREAVGSCSLEEGEDRVEISGPTTLPLTADATHLRSAIANLIRNGLAHSPPDAPVLVHIEPTASEEVIIEVRDRGPGIDPTEREAIFHPFVRGRAGGNARRTGRGLGLFIVRRVIEAHRGRIWVEPTEGPGAVFKALLPTNGRPLGAGNVRGSGRRREADHEKPGVHRT